MPKKAAINQKPTGKLAAGVFNLSGLVRYQERAVVSRTVIDRKTGTITLFAFDRGQGLSEHIAPFDALIYIMDGTADITLEGEPLHLNTGESVILPAGRTHALQAAERFKMMLVMIRS